MNLLRNLVSRIAAAVIVSGGRGHADAEVGDPIKAMPFELEPLEQDLTVIPAAAVRSGSIARARPL